MHYLNVKPVCSFSHQDKSSTVTTTSYSPSSPFTSTTTTPMASSNHNESIEPPSTTIGLTQPSSMRTSLNPLPSRQSSPPLTSPSTTLDVTQLYKVTTIQPLNTPLPSTSPVTSQNAQHLITTPRNLKWLVSSKPRKRPSETDSSNQQKERSRGPKKLNETSKHRSEKSFNGVQTLVVTSSIDPTLPVTTTTTYQVEARTETLQDG